ncbi:MAG: hypothetical protein E7644_06775 [Ruminococcaceae bacterium]|nr:hypothetical protein [Oscillospiraceae bacterium]
MKKLVLSMMLYLLILCLALPCFAYFPVPPEFYAETYQEYKEGLKGKELPDNFVPYDRIRFLGEFSAFCLEDLESNSYLYTLITPEGQKLKVAFNTPPEKRGLTLEQAVIGLDTYCATKGMLKLNMEALLAVTCLDDVENTLIKEFYISDWRYGNIVYFYDRQGDLDRIVLKFDDGEWCAIKTDFAQCTPDSWVGRLLNFSETSQEAANELIMRFRGSDKNTVKQPLTICLSAIGGAVVAALITYLIMRKRRGVEALTAAAAVAAAPVDAVADTPTDIPTDITPPES